MKAETKIEVKKSVIKIKMTHKVPIPWKKKEKVTLRCAVDKDQIPDLLTLT